MKAIFLVAIYLFSANAFADGWNEKLTCEFTRTSETGESVTTIESATFPVAEPNMDMDQLGSVTISSDLIPSYSVSFDLVISGRYELDTLTTTLSSNNLVVAKSSVFDGSKNTNTFVTENGDYLIRIECSHSIVQ